MYSTNEAKLLKSVQVVDTFENQTKWTKFRPNSDHFWQMVWIQTGLEKSDQSGNSECSVMEIMYKYKALY